jgi:hypothetical protein
LGRHLGIRTSVALAVPLHREREQYGSRLAPKQFGEFAASSVSGSADTVAARAAADFADSATGAAGATASKFVLRIDRDG